MSRELELEDFQRAAVDQIVTRLRDTRGSRRFLLADEVGLGKTVVARGVIDKLCRGSRSPLKVIYLSSNSEIAEQNRPKLAKNGGVSVSRAAELALIRSQSDDRVQLYAFTPGTSLAGGTGMAWERRMLLYLLHNICNYDVSSLRWREYFRCGAGAERWQKQTSWTKLRDDFFRRTSVGLQEQLREEIRLPFQGGTLAGAIAEGVDTFDERDRSSKARRNHLISEYRGMLQRVAIRALEPDLIVLDEVQRFKKVIDNANNAHEIASELFRGKAPVLILSATPYKFLTLDDEVRELGVRHHEDFFKTLDFLFGAERSVPTRIRKNLLDFGYRLQKLGLEGERDEQLVALKRQIERDLRLVMCRTERNWYFLDSMQGVAEHGLSHKPLPTREELREFFQIHQGLAASLQGVGLVTDFWKSTPSLLTFMDTGYALTRKLRDGRVRVPRGLLTDPGDPSLIQRNLKLRRLIELSLGEDKSQPLLWVRPTFTYHLDQAYGDRTPRKVLVFSGWRFVPKTIAVVVSNVVAARLRPRSGGHRQPLRLAEKWSFHVFDVCFPSVALAGLVNPRAVASETAQQTGADAVLDAAIHRLRSRLSEVGVKVCPTGKDPLWRAVARLEASSENAALVRTALRQWDGPDDASTRSTDRHRERFLDWMDDRASGVQINEAELTHLALIALSSPATCLLRALMSVFEELSLISVLPDLLRLTFGELRTYFNRPLSQQAVRLHRSHLKRRKGQGRSKRGFARHVLEYSMDHHLQSVLDEHAYLQREAAGRTSVGDMLKHFASVWSLGRGSRRTNEAKGRGDQVPISHDSQVWPTHFALAFGEDGAPGAGPAGEKDDRIRRSEVREAFNSPFWPFVLATTSVGQEGLDFHLYCRDVFHWNLPSNPVDLEQREGRINRRDCLAVRRSIARDWPLERISADLLVQHTNPWTAIFDRMNASGGAHRYKHGLCPHWIYECGDRANTVHIERHIAFFEASRDVQRYNRLKTGLALYRLVFGQVNQEHLLLDLEQRLATLEPPEREEAQRRLAGYMLNLSPIGAVEAQKFANMEALTLLGSEGCVGLELLIEDVRRILGRHGADLSPVREEIEFLITCIEHAITTGERSRQVRLAVTAMSYLRNPYDQFFDAQAVGGFDDDIIVLRKIAKQCGHGRPTRRQQRTSYVRFGGESPEMA